MFIHIFIIPYFSLVCKCFVRCCLNTAASVKAPELSAGNERTAPVNVTITIEQNINGGDTDSIRESNEELVYRIREVMEEISRDGRRRAFN